MEGDQGRERSDATLHFSCTAEVVMIWYSVCKGGVQLVPEVLKQAAGSVKKMD